MSSLNDTGADAPQSDPQMRGLFHQLNNELGILLAHAEMLEVKTADSADRARAAQVVQSVLDAMRTSKEIRLRSESLTIA